MLFRRNDGFCDIVCSQKQLLGFEDMIPDVEASNTEFKKSQKVSCFSAYLGYGSADLHKERARQQPDTGGMSQEELLALQEKLFASSQARFEAGQ